MQFTAAAVVSENPAAGMRPAGQAENLAGSFAVWFDRGVTAIADDAVPVPSEFTALTWNE